MPDIGLGYQIVTQDQVVDTNVIVDMDVPAGKIVISSGINVDSVGGYGTAFKTANGPHPTDGTKWQFHVSTGLENGSTGYPVSCHFWLIVVNLAVSLWNTAARCSRR